MIKVLGISGSPRRHGNTETLLDKALEGASATAGVVVEKIILDEMDLRPCRSCGGCSDTASCIVEDDMRLIRARVSEADVLIVASPVYYGSISAQLKTMIDRFQPNWIAKYALKKPVLKNSRRKGLFLCVSSFNKPAFFQNADSIVSIFFRTLDVEYSGGIFCGGVDAVGEINKKTSVMTKAFRAGAKLAEGLWRG
ncbi:MAG: flavodoxin family protein [Candidatus Omnitrophica bacterium]|nr:flavodoxin family protein [Candidatus Omnitrophota bacterium]